MTPLPEDESTSVVHARDYAGARRGRRAFRYAVAAFVLLTFSLWFSEGYLRFDKCETQYRMSLTLQEASARAILRNVVKRDSQLHDTPTSKYVEALAGIEEKDQVLPVYEQAYALDPKNALLIVKYGCRLFHENRYTEARDRFREASLQSQENSLPRYLEAAALMASFTPKDDVSDVIALIARTNTMEAPVRFPKPLWHATLPVHGEWHAKVRRNLVDQCLAPIYSLESAVRLRAEKDIRTGEMGEWDAWLGELETMGGHLVGDAETPDDELGVGQAIAGVSMQLDALQLRESIHRDKTKNLADAATVERVRLLESARDQLAAFENSWLDRVAAQRKGLAAPNMAAAKLLAVLFLGYLVSLVAGIMFGSAARDAKSAPHRPIGLALSGIAAIGWLVLLMLSMGGLNRLTPNTMLFIYGPFWSVICGAILLAALLYPAWQLFRSGQSVLAPYRDPSSSTFRWMTAVISLYFGLTRRYVGILLGFFLCVICVWLISYRLITGLYPFQLELLTTGLQDEEIKLIRGIQSLLIQ